LRLKNIRYRAENAGMAKSKLVALNKLDAIAEDSRLKEIYISIVKEIGVKNSINIGDYSN